MNNNLKEVLKTLNAKNIILPFLLGFSFILYIIFSDKDFTINNILIVKEMKAIGIVGSLMMLLIRDFLYVFRIRLLVNKEIPWIKCLVIV